MSNTELDMTGFDLVDKLQHELEENFRLCIHTKIGKNIEDTAKRAVKLAKRINMYVILQHNDYYVHVSYDDDWPSVVNRFWEQVR